MGASGLLGKTFVLAVVFSAANSFNLEDGRPFQRFEPHLPPQFAQGEVGEPLYLSPYIQSGDIATAKQLAQVTEPLDGLGSLQPLSYSGYLTVDEVAQNHLFFWFFPASEVDPSSAPVVIWLQGGPGSSSMYGLFEINGPISAVSCGSGCVTGEINDFSWHKRANMIYIDNPVGSGFSHSYTNTFVTNQDEVARDLYNMLTQWYTLFPEYQANNFFAFGESYAGKYVPAIAERIHQENQGSPAIRINLRGAATGNPATDPYYSFVYADYLYQLGLIDEIDRDSFLGLEAEFQAAIAREDWTEAQRVTNLEFNEALNRIGCSYAYDFRQCGNDPEENDYADYVNLDSTRLAIHVGDTPFGSQSGAVYSALYEDIPQSVKDRVETILDNGYDYMLYSGNTDIICHHTGNLAYLETLQWAGQSTYLSTGNDVYRVDGETVGYVTSANNMKVFVVRNAGHAAPRYQPSAALQMFTDFINGAL